jgi:hypothetical protein
MSNLRYLCLLAYNGVQHILCCVFVLFFFVLCTQCRHCLWIVHSWLPFRFSLTFIYKSIKAYRQLCRIFSRWHHHLYHEQELGEPSAVLRSLVHLFASPTPRISVNYHSCLQYWQWLLLYHKVMGCHGHLQKLENRIEQM